MSDLKVTIKDETGNQSTKTVTSSKPSTPQKAAEKLDPKNDSTNSTKKDNQGLAVASMIASRSFNYCTQNVGKWTGNSANQARIGRTQQAMGVGTAAVFNPIFGLATAGFELGTTAIDASRDNQLARARSSLKMLQAGYDDYNKVIGGRK